MSIRIFIVLIVKCKFSQFPRFRKLTALVSNHKVADRLAPYFMLRDPSTSEVRSSKKTVSYESEKRNERGLKLS